MQKINKQIIIIVLILMILLLFISFSIRLILNNKETELKSVETLYTPQENISQNEVQKEEIQVSSTDWNLILVNKNNKIPEEYNVELQEVEDNHMVDKRIVDNLKNMLQDARKQGLDPIICSSYRTNSKQVQLYNNKVREYKRQGYNSQKAEELASFWVAIPGTGEHETGLAVDIVSRKYQILDEEQEKTKEQEWLIENSYKYGFILRYPTEKKALTMINYEPWHYRYVGIENAKYIKENDMCLEEYINYLKEKELNDKTEV